MEKVKIVLDADVLIHFAKAECLSMLPTILPEYEHVVLSAVYEEVKMIRQQLDNQIHLLRNIKIEQFAPTGQMRREYAVLLSRFGKGESACMAYCRFTNNVIGSSTTETIHLMIKENPKITGKELASKCGITEDGVAYYIKKLKARSFTA